MEKPSDVEIVAVRLEGGSGHEHITHLLWQGTSSSGVTTSAALIDLLGKTREHEVWVRDGGQRVAVEVVTVSGGRAYLRSRYDGQWGAHLLGLARF
jgi:hypothetical protein